MTKLIKILRNSFLFIIEYVLIIIIFLAFAIRTSSFQTFIGKQVTNYFSKRFEVPISLGKVDISFFDRVYFDRLFIPDQKGDTLIYIHELFVNIDHFDISKVSFNIDEIGLNGANVELKKYKSEEVSNFQFILDEFKSNSNDTAHVDFTFSVNDFSITNSQFSFENQHEERTNFGVDYNYIDLKELNAKFKAVKINPESYEANIKELKTIDQSGFQLINLSAEAEFSDKGLNLSNTDITTPQSRLSLNSFQLLAESLSDFGTFNEKVQLKSKLVNSDVSLFDVSLFAPQLQGMNNVVKLSCETDNTVDALQINNLNLRYKQRTQLRGDFNLIDFENILNDRLNQTISTVSIAPDEIRTLRLPNSSNSEFFELPEQLSSLDFIRLNKIRIDGTVYNLRLSLETITTNLGEVYWRVPMNILSDSSFTNISLTPERPIDNQIVFNQIDLGQLSKDNRFGLVNGGIEFERLIVNGNSVKVSGVNGTFKNFRFLSHSYDFLVFDNINYDLDNRGWKTRSQIDGIVYVRDNDLDFSFNGLASIGEELEMNANLTVDCAHLAELSPSFANRGELETTLTVDVKGVDFQDFKGDLDIESLYYEEHDQSFETTFFNASMERSSKVDKLFLVSDFIDADVMGKIDFDNVSKNIVSELNSIFPALISNANEEIIDSSYFDYRFQIKDINPILEVIYPSLNIAKNTIIEGRYTGKENEISMNIDSESISYDSTRVEGISVTQDIYKNELLAFLKADRVYRNDSLVFQEVHFTNLTANGFMDSQFIIHDTEDNRSNLEFYTHLFDLGGFDIDVLPSYVSLNGHKWELKNRAHINYTDDCFFIEDLKFEYDKQYILAEGQLSEHPYDKLYVDVMNVDLTDVGLLISQDFDLAGRANAAGSISTPISGLKFNGDAVFEDLYVNNTEVGNVSFGADFDTEKEKITMFGDLIYKRNKTFGFNGDYYLNKNEDDPKGNLDFNMVMNGTDVSVVNEFLDPDVISEFSGFLTGNLSLTGTMNEPLLQGKVNVDDGKVNLAILGADMFFEGELESVDDGFYINSMPLQDEGGNTGFITGSLFHDNFQNFNFEVIVNLEEHPFERMPNNSSKALPVEKFKIMDTEYSEYEPYYGTAYITGRAIISGYADNLNIDVGATTKKGTNIIFPMYGPTSIEEEGFISFKGTGQEEREKRVDLTGVDLNFDFDVTDDAQVKLIFDENIGDEISARGSGDLTMGVDQYGELTLNGLYTVSEGVYNFAIGPIKQNFNIEKGGTLQWTGSPYDAIMDISASYQTRANIAVVMADIIENRSSDNELIKSYLYLNGDMMSPEISFDLEAPNASESAKAVLSRIRSDQDELNKQFLSILISRSFLPLENSDRGLGGSGGALLDLASTQINSILNKVSQSYQINVNLENDDLSGQFSGALGLSKNFLNDRLQVSGSFGVGSLGGESDVNQSAPGQNTIIGDVEVEYLLNKDGTFRVVAFNESNNNQALQNSNQGLFTQGIGVSYKEDFHTLEDLKLFQFFVNIFRKEENRKDIPNKNKNERPIPQAYQNKNSKNEEE
jgi:hypothetical protein